MGFGESATDEQQLAYPLLPEGVYTKPYSVSELQSLTPEQKSAVGNFTIGKAGYGEISYNVAGSDVTDVRSLDLRQAFTWSGKKHRTTNLGMYKDIEPKPDVGTKLNKPATLKVYFNKDWTYTRIVNTFERRINGEFVDFDRDTKLLSFRISSF